MATTTITRIYEVNIKGDKKPWSIRNAVFTDGTPFVRLCVGDAGFCRFINGSGRNGLAQYAFTCELRNLRNLARLHHVRSQDGDANGLQPETDVPTWSKSWAMRAEFILLKRHSKSDSAKCVPIALPEIVDSDLKTWGPLEAEVLFTLDNMAVVEVAEPVCA